MDAQAAADQASRLRELKSLAASLEEQISAKEAAFAENPSQVAAAKLAEARDRLAPHTEAAARKTATLGQLQQETGALEEVVRFMNERLYQRARQGASAAPLVPQELSLATSQLRQGVKARIVAEQAKDDTHHTLQEKIKEREAMTEVLRQLLEDERELDRAGAGPHVA